MRFLVIFYRWFGFSTNLTEEGYQVIIVKNSTDEEVPGRYLDQWTKYYYMCIDWNLKRETVNGVIIVYDMATTNKNELLTQATPSFLRKSLQCSVSFEVYNFLQYDGKVYVVIFSPLSLKYHYRFSIYHNFITTFVFTFFRLMHFYAKLFTYKPIYIYYV